MLLLKVVLIGELVVQWVTCLRAWFAEGRSGRAEGAL